RPPQTLTALQNADASKKLVISAAKVPEREVPTSGNNFRAGLRDSITAQGWEFDPDRRVTIADVPFVCLVARKPSSKHWMIAYTTTNGREVYALLFILNQDIGMNDPELRSIIRSFHLLSADPIK